MSILGPVIRYLLRDKHFWYRNPHFVSATNILGSRIRFWFRDDHFWSRDPFFVSAMSILVPPCVFANARNTPEADLSICHVHFAQIPNPRPVFAECLIFI